MTIFLFDRVENTVGKRENAWHQHFLLSPQCFPKPSSFVSLKVEIVWEWVKGCNIKALVTLHNVGKFEEEN